ncbi:crossover junction endodeoxyribonuclease RuvC [Helcococcus ovis]|uniref:crossover junction endodeoxyribonuclease RuvC n=1 Tax=Helcococcus ovis TaxID=72026 RepID=UPI00106F8EFB|nr:crossover junction endodeoxyribonuclease RuvC [Helcococcus ovis]TFF68101.1 crossover junction endodeoxyribonuclease RuvC [Helcococcus ovis]WNZ01958.1 crossover junction endodeoxyribonuclease RuvC [Helcococcus ovis]
MIILGIDPGIAIVGYGIIKKDGNTISMLEYGSIQTDANIKTQDRLEIIFNELNAIIKQYKPTEVVYEKLFHEKNTKTFINVSQARGVEILAAKVNNLEIYEYTPLQIKTALTGYGRAVKKQVQESVKRILNLKDIPKPDDAADALAIAICHSFSGKLKDLYKME